MREIFNKMVKGESEMLRKNTPLTLGLSAGAGLFVVAGMALTNGVCLQLGLSLAVINLTVAYMEGRRLAQRENTPHNKNNDPRP